MTAKPRQTNQLRDYILNQVDAHPTDIARLAAAHFGVSRQAVVKQLNSLAAQGFLVGSGATKGKRYGLAWLVEKAFVHPITAELQEDTVWRTDIRRELEGVKENVVEICQYGFTEVFNNAIEHSQSAQVATSARRNAVIISLSVSDSGVGIFSKIQHDLHLSDPHHALLELTKGKLTTDPRRHTGEGLFSTSRMFDSFSIMSGDLYFSATLDEGQWRIKTESRDAVTGTSVELRIRTDSKRTLGEIFAKYSGKPNFDFSRTDFPVKLALYGDELLVSRSQARRVLARFEEFREVVMDFSGVATIGHSFADEIFRVFKTEHPEVNIIAINATDEVGSVINKAIASAL